MPEIFNVTAKGRSLLTFSELDVQRDLMDFSFVLRSDVEEEELLFYLELLDWQPTHLDILVNFTDPLLISKGLVRDQIVVTIKNPEYFVSNVTGKQL